jgi:hypothetical protein
VFKHQNELLLEEVLLEEEEEDEEEEEEAYVQDIIAAIMNGTNEAASPASTARPSARSTPRRRRCEL